MYNLYHKCLQNMNYKLTHNIVNIVQRKKISSILVSDYRLDGVGASLRTP